MAKIQPPRRVQTTDRQLNEIQDAIAQPLRQVLDVDLLSGRSSVAVVLTTTPQPIRHGLGRRPVGWMLTDKQGPGDAYRTEWDERTITLRVASGTLVGDLWIW